jgi:hypothetical protein
MLAQKAAIRLMWKVHKIMISENVMSSTSHLRQPQGNNLINYNDMLHN